MKRLFWLISLSALLIHTHVLPLEAAGVGLVTGIRGEATVRRDPTPAPLALKFKDDLFWRDILNTGADSRLRLLVLQKSVITMKELSRLQLIEEDITPAQPRKKSIMNLISGAIRAVVEKDALKDTDYEVRTPLAVAAIRGSDLIAEMSPNPDEANYYTGAGASATLMHSNPAVGTRDIPELTRARVTLNAIELLPHDLVRHQTLAAGIAPKGPQAANHQPGRPQASIADKIYSQALEASQRIVAAVSGLSGFTGSSDPTARSAMSPTSTVTTALVTPSTTGLTTNGVTALSDSAFTSAIATDVKSLTFLSATEVHTFRVNTSGTEWFVSVKDCCIPGDIWKATISHSGREVASATGDGGTSVFSPRAGVSSTGAKTFDVTVRYVRGTDIFSAGMDTRFETTKGGITIEEITGGQSVARLRRK